MKVAIIGAGVSGLSCAFELKKHDIIPEIFEKGSCVGENPGFMISTFRIFDRTYRTPQEYLKSTYGLNITPLYSIERVFINTAGQSITITGKLGYAYKRGKEPFSVENQIALQVNIPINFNCNMDIEDIKDGFDYVVVADASTKTAKKFNLWKTTLDTYARITTVKGDFSDFSGTIWYNTSYSNNCFCYLTVINRNEASLVLTVNDILESEIDVFWNSFWDGEGFKYEIAEMKDIRVETGTVGRLQFENVYLTGNAGGLLDSYMGLGTIHSIESGIQAARSIVGKLEYYKLVLPNIKHIKMMHEYRKIINTFDDRKLDLLVSTIGLPGIKQFIYNNPLFKAYHAAYIALLINKLAGRS